MAIVKMKKLRLMAVRSARDELLKELLGRGCVEVSEPAELRDEAFSSLVRAEDGGLMAARGREQALQNALEILDRYAPAKSPLLSPKPEVAGEKLLDEQALEQAQRDFADKEQQLARYTALQAELQTMLADVGALLQE